MRRPLARGRAAAGGLALAWVAAVLACRTWFGPSLATGPTHGHGARGGEDSSRVEGNLRVRRPLVYVYDWHARCKELGFCDASSTWAFRPHEPYPFGSQVWRDSDGLVEANTDQFSLASIFDYRLAHSAWRTTDPSKATLFYIPYDPLIDSYRNPFTPHGLYNSKKEEFMEEIIQSEWFKRKNGLDHFMAISHVRMFNHGQQLVNDLLANVTKLTIENNVIPTRFNDELGRSRVSWLFNASLARKNDTLPKRGALWALSKQLESNAAMELPANMIPSYWATVPYPSYVHPRKSFDPQVYDPCTNFKRKDIMISMAFSTSLGSFHAKSIRQRLLLECIANDDICRFLHLQRHLNYNNSEFRDVYAVYQRSKYCIVPMGDSFSSKRWFDAVSSCCVPVLAGIKPANFLTIYQFAPFKSRVADLHTFVLSRNDLEQDFDRIRKDRGRTFYRRLYKLREHFFSLSYALEDHPIFFDAVDLSVDALSRTRVD